MAQILLDNRMMSKQGYEVTAQFTPVGNESSIIHTYLSGSGKCHQLSRIWLVLIHQCVVSTRVLVIHLCVVHYSPPQNSGVYKEVNEYHLHWTKP
ncbi:hypothetical protein M8J77_025298 [Diaphorina citri]|nr:hypothetical protein M8J77_025298 [Diaphorina citri]